MRPKVFISRAQTAQSPFQQLLAPHAEVVGRSLIAFEAVQPSPIPEGDWLFFYSKRGLEYGLSHWQGRTGFPKIAVMGQASAEYLNQEFGATPDFVGRGEPAEIAAAFGTQAQGARVLFVQAAQSRQSVQHHLGKRVKAVSVVVYNNVAQPVENLPYFQLLAFTSPLNVAGYFYNHTLQPEQHFIGIGATTATALRAQGVERLSIASEPTELALAQACLQQLQQ